MKKRNLFPFPEHLSSIRIFHIANILAGSELKIANADGLNSSTGNLQTAVVNYNEGANYTFAGASAQVTGTSLPATVNNLTVNNAAGLTLSASQTVAGTLTLTNGTGKLIRPALAATEITFPVGPTVDSYDPASLTPTDATSIAVKVGTTLPAVAPLNYIYNEKVWDITPVSASSTIVKLTPSTAVSTQKSDVVGHYNGSEYVNIYAVKSGNTYQATVSSFSPFVTGTTDVETGLNGNTLHATVYLDGNIIRNIQSEKLSVFDFSGKLLLTSNQDIDLSNHVKGVYFVKGISGVIKIALTK